MLIKFQSEDSGDFVMFGEVATQLLRMMGMSGKPEGSVDADGVAEALKKLETALQRTQPASNTGNSDKSQNASRDENQEEPAVGLSTRAGPLLDMLRRARETNSYVMWRPE